MRSVSRLSKVAVFALVAALLLLGLAVLLRPARDRPEPTQQTAESERAQTLETAQVVFQGKFENGWSDWGWGPHEYADAGPARISFEAYGGIVLQHAEQPGRFGALTFQFRPPDALTPDFLKVTLRSAGSDTALLPSVSLTPDLLTPLKDGWQKAVVPFSTLNPRNADFNRIAIEARRMVAKDWVLLDSILLTKAGSAGPGTPVALTIDCKKPTIAVNPLIYGISRATAELGETGRRIGGNPMTRLNWDRAAWNTGNDWFFENVGASDNGMWDWVKRARKSEVKEAIVVPMIGWVAKDRSSVSFPVSRFGPQRKTDPNRPDVGDGAKPDGSLLTPASPEATSVQAPPELIRSWIEKLRAGDVEAGGRAASMYILDNEPSLWSSTHRDVHPEPVGYDELLDRTIRYGSAIRQADPDAVIAGPAEWGWTGYFYSAVDNAASFGLKPDRLAHGGIALLPWYLRKLASYEHDKGVHILDVLDVHFYPQGSGLFGGDAKTDADASERRIRSTRALWDPSYVDESWIKDRINLIPRMQAWIAENYPGRGVSLGEWSFGADTHISGGLAIAEALGRFGESGLTSAYYWGTLEPGTPGYLGFQAFRNFDGKGAHFLERSIPATGAHNVSLFASRNMDSTKVVAVLINLNAERDISASITLGACGGVTSVRVFGFGPGSKKSEELANEGRGTDTVREVFVPPYSVRVVAFELEPKP